MLSRRTFATLLAGAAAAAALPLSSPAMSLFTPARPKLLIFDVNETLLDLGKLQQAVNQEFKSEFAFKQWFSLLLQYSLVDTVTGHYHDFPAIGDAGFDMLAQSLGQPARPAARKKELLRLITELPPHPDVVPGLTALQKAGFRMITLTNSPGPTVQKQMAYAQLTPFFEQLLSIDVQKRYKPHLDTYATACRQLKVAPQDTMLLAAHGWDVAGAQWAGMRSAFVARPGQTVYPLADAPDHTVSDLGELVTVLLATGH